MRGASLGGGLRLAALVASSLGATAAAAGRSVADFGLSLAALPRAGHHMGRTRYPAGYNPHGRSIAERNRHTGKAHEHKREIARRKRQAERVRENRLARAERRGSRVHVGADGPKIGLTRRGRAVAV